MRSFVLLFVLIMAALAASGAAWAKTTAEIGKPVCTQYDDNAKQTAARASNDAGASAAPAVSASMAASAPTSGVAASAQSRSGAGTAMHSRGAPRWQTLLPGMFR
jgi:hypothetical protein